MTTIEAERELAGIEPAAAETDGPRLSAGGENADGTVLPVHIRKAPAVSPSRKCEEVIEQFAQMPDCECVVVCDTDHRPVGLVMKSRLTIIQTHRFGPELYYNRSIVKLMDENPLIVDAGISPQELIGLALGREERTLYDAVVVTENGRFAGVLNMSDLLELSRMLQRQSVELQMETVAGTETRIRDIDRAVGQVLDAAKRGDRMSERMVDLTLKGKNELDKVTEAFISLTDNAVKQDSQIGELQERAGAIGQVSKLIRELADQCNLLAVNATIEAARAGEHGRGFAVVADEVRQLADQTKKSADQINAMIRAIMDSVKQTAELVGAGRADTDSSRVHVQAAFEQFEQLFHAAAGNRKNAADIGRLSEQASNQSRQVLDEMKRLASEMRIG